MYSPVRLGLYVGYYARPPQLDHLANALDSGLPAADGPENTTGHKRSALKTLVVEKQSFLFQQPLKKIHLLCMCVQMRVSEI